MELTDSGKALFIETAHALKGSARRIFMARTVREWGAGGQRRAAREFGWDRETIRKGARALARGVAIVDAFALRGRKRSAAHLPQLLADIAALVDGQSQTDPSFRSARLYTRLPAAEVRRQLIAQKGYTDAQLPTVQTIGAKLHALGDPPQTVAQSKPQKRSPQPTLSSPRCARSIGPLTPRRGYGASRSRPRQRSRSARARAGGSAGCRLPPPTTISSRKRP